MAVPDGARRRSPSSRRRLSGPFDDVEIVGDTVDWEVELVAVIGGGPTGSARPTGGPRRRAHRRPGHQRPPLQFAAGAQFSLGKSRRGYGPMGPWVVTPDELADRDDLALGCSVDGETVQDARTSDLMFSVPQLVAELSAVLPLLPGDIIFTGTPAGVGFTRQPPRFLQPGQVLEIVDRGHRHDPQHLRLTRRKRAVGRGLERGDVDLRMPNMACMARSSVRGRDRSAPRPMPAGHTCHDSPNLSLSHPHSTPRPRRRGARPSSDRARLGPAQSMSSETASSKVNWGPPLMAVNG